MFTHTKSRMQNGFTILELLVVIAIIGILSAIVLVSMSDSKMKGRDASRKAQLQEVLKGLELFYTDGGMYPDDGTPADTATGAALTNIDSGFIGSQYFKRLPEDHERYQYCVSADKRSMVLALDTEEDKGGSKYCSVLRGPGPNYGCTAWRTANATELCATRF